MNIASRAATKASKLLNLCLWKVYSSKRKRPDIAKITQNGHDEDGDHIFEVVGDCYIQPRSGYVICNGHIIWESMHLNWNPNAKISLLDVPSFIEYHRTRLDPSTSTHFHNVVHCRHFYEWNYFHFFLDVLPKISAFENANINLNVPIVVGKYVNELSFASQTLSETQFNKYDWLVQNSNYIRCRSVKFCRLNSSYRSRTEQVTKKFDFSLDDVCNERIYLTRGRCSGRRVKNEQEVLDVMRSLDFKIYDTNGMHILDQTRLFRNARYVVAPHGAGLTNIQFRQDEPLSVLELHPYTPTTDFQKMCNEFGHYWSSLKGNADQRVHPQKADFSIDPGLLRQKVTELLAT